MPLPLAATLQSPCYERMNTFLIFAFCVTVLEFCIIPLFGPHNSSVKSADQVLLSLLFLQLSNRVIYSVTRSQQVTSRRLKRQSVDLRFGTSSPASNRLESSTAMTFFCLPARRRRVSQQHGGTSLPCTGDPHRDHTNRIVVWPCFGVRLPGFKPQLLCLLAGRRGGLFRNFSGSQFHISSVRGRVITLLHEMAVSTK